LVDFLLPNNHILLDENGGDFLWFGWLKHVLKCHEKGLKNSVSLHNFIEKDSIGLAMFVQIAPNF
jgi:hypothetical protein